MFVGNNAYEVSLPNAGGRAVLDRGELCLYVVGCRSRWGLLRMAARAALGRLEGRDLEMRLAAEAEIRSRMRRPLRVSIDGEVAARRPPLRYRIRRGPCASSRRNRDEPRLGRRPPPGAGRAWLERSTPHEADG